MTKRQPRKLLSLALQVIAYIIITLHNYLHYYYIYIT